MAADGARGRESCKQERQSGSSTDLRSLVAGRLSAGGVRRAHVLSQRQRSPSLAHPLWQGDLGRLDCAHSPSRGDLNPISQWPGEGEQGFRAASLESIGCERERTRLIWQVLSLHSTFR